MIEIIKREPGISIGLLINSMIELERSGVAEIPEKDFTAAGIRRLLCEYGLEQIANLIALEAEVAASGGGDE